MIIVHVITGLGNGGAEGVLYRLITHEKKHKHYVVSLMDLGKYGPLLCNERVSVYCLHMSAGRITLNGLYRLYKIITNINPDTVQTWMYHADLIGGLIARLARVKNICWGIRHTTLEFGKSSFVTILITRVNAVLSYFVPHSIVCCAESAKNIHISLGYSKNKMIVIPNGYDLNYFKRDEAYRIKFRKDLFGVDESDFVIGMMARYDPQKDHASLIKALFDFKQKGYHFCCILAGNGVDSNNLELVELIESFGLTGNIKLFGVCNNTPAIYNAIDLHVLPSSYGEGFPNVIAEAMACETPCVSTDTGDSNLIVGHTGWIVKPNDSHILSLSIEKAALLSKDYNSWRLRGVMARSHIEKNYSINFMIDSYVDLWMNNS